MKIFLYPLIRPKDPTIKQDVEKNDQKETLTRLIMSASVKKCTEFVL